MRVRVAAIAGAVLLLAPVHLAAQEQVILSGRVLEFGTRTGINSATVSVQGVGQVATRNNGQFTLPRMTPGQRTVTISALGYQTLQLSIDVRRDTVILVELEVEAVKIDSLRVEARSITLRGSISDQISHEPIFDADVAVANSKFASSNILGNFKVRSVPAGTPVTVAVRAPGYLPYGTTITFDRDTTLRINLEIDPVGQQMIAAQVERFRKRSNSVNAQLRNWNRDALAATPREALADFLKHHFAGKPTCFFVDDMDRSSWLPDILTSYIIDELERIEVYDRGLMLRIYTRRYIAKQSSSRRLPAIVYMRAGRGKPVCM